MEYEGSNTKNYFMILSAQGERWMGLCCGCSDITITCPFRITSLPTRVSGKAAADATLLYEIGEKFVRIEQGIANQAQFCPQLSQSNYKLLQYKLTICWHATCHLKLWAIT